MNGHNYYLDYYLVASVFFICAVFAMLFLPDDYNKLVWGLLLSAGWGFYGYAKGKGDRV